MSQVNVNGKVSPPAEVHQVNIGPGRYSAEDHSEVKMDDYSRTIDSETNMVAANLRDILPAMIQDEVRREEQEKAQSAKAEEDKRANHRNFNRLMMLVVAMVWSFIAPTLMIALWGPGSLKYSLFVTILPDACLTVYALIRKY